MSSIRAQLLAAIHRNGQLTNQELADSTEIPAKQVQQNVSALRQEYLLERIKDDVTGLPASRLTDKGKKWCKDNLKPADLAAAAKQTAVPPAKADATFSQIAEREAAQASTMAPVPTERSMADMLKQLHEQGNDIAGYKMMLDAIMGRLGVTEPTQILGALSDRLARPSHLGTPGVVVIASDYSESLIRLPGTSDAKIKAHELVESGEAVEAIVVNILGRARMPKPEIEWSES
jgi:DNA-binding MarR family transcriptional regulator